MCVGVWVYEDVCVCKDMCMKLHVQCTLSKSLAK